MVGIVLSTSFVVAALEEVDIAGDSLSIPESLLLSPMTGPVMMGGF
jgi:hypothetical protein